ncbi:MAG TPA: F0F1 ATP synthase subunit A [Gemmatimonadaceae bacterium]|nr:F0F1 ATP synthase subunit A [Gemmatimonadaceae bacterium]
MRRLTTTAVLAGLLIVGTRLPAQEKVDYITPHITDAHHIELPWFKPPFAKEVELPRWAPVHIGKFEVDFSPTKHVVFLLLGTTLASLVLVGAARAHKRQIDTLGHPTGFAAAIEWMVDYFKNDVILPNVGPHGEAFVPFCLALFFFILTGNLFGLLPWGSTITGNISVTATLAIISFFVVEIAGMRALGLGYLNTIVYWPHDMPLMMKAPLTVIMTPIELLGKITKPFALAIRLFANMTGGHIVVLAIIGLVFAFGSWIIAPLPILGVVALMFLELLVAFLQAFVFCLLVSVFIGQVRASHH